MQFVKPTYNASVTSKFYDNYGAREWNRLDNGLANRVQVVTHRAMLEQFVKAGDRVLEIGAGPGRFTIELARLGAVITVGDISEEQLRLNKEKVAEQGIGNHVTGWHHADICDLSAWADGAFDVVVCFGGALGCVLDKADQGMAELLRVTKSGGRLLVSVTSRYGFLRCLMPEAMKFVAENPLFASFLDASVQSGDDLGFGRELQLPSHLYSWSELGELISRHGGKVVAGSSANFLSIDVRNGDTILTNEELLQSFLSWELAACRQPGAYDGGTHIIAAAEKP